MPSHPVTPAGVQMPAAALSPTAVQTSGTAPGAVAASGSAAPSAAPANAPHDPKIWAAAQKFEAMAIGQLLAPMFDTVDLSKTKFGGGQGESAWKPMMVDAIGKQIEAHGGFGLAQPVYAAMLRAQETSAPAGGAPAGAAHAGGAQGGGGQGGGTTHAANTHGGGTYIASPAAGSAAGGLAQAGLAQAGVAQAGSALTGSAQTGVAQPGSALAGGSRPAGVPASCVQTGAAGQTAPDVHQPANRVQPQGKTQ